MPRTTLARLALVLCSTLMLDRAGAGEDYEIKFDRPTKVGERYGVVTKGASRQVSKSKVGGEAQPEEREEMSVEMTADLEVLALTPKGEIQKIRLTSTKVTVEIDGKTAPLFPDGTEVTAEHDGENTHFKLDGRPAGELVAKALELVIKLSSGDTSDDVIFGTKQRQPIGKRWPMNSGAAATSLSKIVGYNIDAKSITGGCQIMEVVQTEAGPALRLQGDISITGLKAPLSPGLKVRSAGARAKMSGLLPVEVQKGALETGMTFELEMVVGGTANGQKIEIETKSMESVHERYLYPK